MLKICCQCSNELPLNSFNVRQRNPDGRDNRCKNCTRERDKLRYRKDIEGQRTRSIESGRVTKLRNASYILEYLSSHPCVDCGENDPIVLEFDHIIGDKVDAVSEMITRFSLARLKEEISKCEIRCANCHRRKTAKSRNYYRTTKSFNIDLSDLKIA